MPEVATSLREVTAIRYVTPLREGGSLPGLMEADDLGTYAVKFRGAGQGPPVLVAEVIAGELARALGLPVPEQLVVWLDPALGASEPDQEVQELLRKSPEAWLVDGPARPADPRAAYAKVLARRLAARDAWLPPLLAAVTEAAVHPPYRPGDPLGRLRRERGGQR
jgi:hypothetical protein